MKHLIFVFVLAALFNLLSCQSVDKKQAVVDLSEEQFNDYRVQFNQENSNYNIDQSVFKDYETYLDALGTGLNDMIITCKTSKDVINVTNKQYEQAVSMLYKLDPEDAWNEPLQLSNEEMSNVVCMLKQIPVLSYRINNIKFKTALMNEVKCTIVMREADGTVPEAANKWYFKPVNYLGGWRLCLMDSNS